ncbi:AsnC family transcriptional regulator [Halobacteriales archaeon QS_3_64_16]|nr:MAG: AsnC family transcriptional regulator [Halobacteriales archaeon QS_3_64_16]
MDNIDREILESLVEGARRPYRKIAPAVDRSPPTVSERIERLEGLGIIEGFSLDIDRSMLVEGTTVLIELEVAPGEAEAVAEDLVPVIEHVVETVDGAVQGLAHRGEEEIREPLAEEIDAESIREYSVRLVPASHWEPTLGEMSVGIECVVCGKSVDSGGVSIDLGEDSYEVCCFFCVTEIEAQYEQLS